MMYNTTRVQVEQPARTSMYCTCYTLDPCSDQRNTGKEGATRPQAPRSSARSFAEGRSRCWLLEKERPVAHQRRGPLRCRHRARRVQQREYVTQLQPSRRREGGAKKSPNAALARCVENLPSPNCFGRRQPEKRAAVVRDRLNRHFAHWQHGAATTAPAFRPPTVAVPPILPVPTPDHSNLHLRSVAGARSHPMEINCTNWTYYAIHFWR